MRSVRLLPAIVVTTLGLIAVVVAVPSLRWRFELVGLYLAGEIPDFDVRDLVSVLRPDSPQQSARLVETRNPYAVMQNPYTSAASIAAGERLYAATCGACHGDDRRGTRAAPSLVDGIWKHGDSDWAVFRVIRHGVPTQGMPANSFSDQQIWRLVAFVRSGEADGATAVVVQEQGTLAAINVPYEQIAEVTAPGADWLTYGGSYSSHRHSALTAISPANVASLALRWIHQVPGDPGDIQASAIVRDGVAFITAPANVVLALDASSGRELWRYERPPPDNLRAGEFGVRSNRGVAILDRRVFVATGDAKLVAVAAATGKVLWEAVVDDKRTHKITSAPLAFRDLVVIGTGTQAGGRGAIAAYGAADGVERWRFNSVPGPGEPGHESWEGRSWETGGASPWQTGSYDPVADLLIWGIGNPKPDYDAMARRGDNLYSNSVVALRGTSGELVWHFQFTPGDDHDWDSAQSPLLVDVANSRRVLWANRNGFYYVLDRTDGLFKSAVPFVRQNWAQGIDSRGRPRLNPEAGDGTRGTLTYPSNGGGTNWWAPSYDAALDLVFVPVLEQGMVFFRSSSSWPRSTGQPFRTGVRALDAGSGRVAWEHMHEPRRERSETGSLMSTTSGLLFGSDMSTFFALESRTGKLLWSVETGGPIESPPVTYSVSGKQYVLIVAGGDILGFALPSESPVSPTASISGSPPVALWP